MKKNPNLNSKDGLMVDIAELHHDPVADLVNRMEAKTMHPLKDRVPAPQGGERPTGLQHHGGQGQVPRVP
jgi:hypothetical protein